MTKQCYDDQHTPEALFAAKAKGRAFGSLQVTLWSLLTLAVLARVYLFVYLALEARRPVDMLGLVIHSALVGVLGMVVITVVELHLEPWRFVERDEPPRTR